MERFFVFLVFFTASNVGAGEDMVGQNWLLITTPALRDAFEPLVELRRKQGYRVSVVDDWQSGAAKDIGLAERISGRIKESCATAEQTFVLIGGSYRPTDGKSFVPTTNGVHGRMNTQPTDYYYSFPNALGMPTVAVGRLPARNPEEAIGMVRKVVQSEDERPDSTSPHLGIIVAHPGGETQLEKQFGEVFLQITVSDRLKKLDPNMRVRVVADIENSEFANPNQNFENQAIDVLTSGSVFTVYCGHSSASGLWSKSRYVVSRDGFANLKSEGYPGVFFSCGCFTCQIDEKPRLRLQVKRSDRESEAVTASSQGFGLAAIRNPNGPAAVIGPYGESFAAFGKLAFDALERQVGAKDPSTRIGGYWTAVQRGIVQGEMDAVTFFLFDQADGSRGKTSFVKQRSEHVEMWTLLGDPAMSLPSFPNASNDASADQSGPRPLALPIGSPPSQRCRSRGHWRFAEKS